MLLSALFAFRVSPVLRVDLLSHFSHVCSGKKIEVLISEYICEINMSHRPYPVINLFCRTTRGSAKSSELVITAPD